LEDPKAIGHPAGMNAGDLKGDDFARKNREDPADGPCEKKIPVAPMHHLGKADFLDHLGKHLAEDLKRGASLHLLDGAHDLALGRLLALEFGESHPLGASKALPRLGRDALGVKSHLDRRAGDFDLDVFLHLRQAFDKKSQAPRRGIALDRRGGQTVFLKRRSDCGTHLFQGGPYIRGGNLLATDFENGVF
jgi:hypothetical protein